MCHCIATAPQAINILREGVFEMVMVTSSGALSKMPPFLKNWDVFVMEIKDVSSETDLGNVDVLQMRIYLVFKIFLKIFSK